MTNNWAIARKSLRAMALASVSMIATSAFADPGEKPLKLTVITPTAPAQGGAIQPLYGNISPFYGNISPFYGNISPFYGNISPFYGNISAFYGNISAFSGQIDPFWGNISAFSTGLGANANAVPLNYAGIGAFVSNFDTQATSIINNWHVLGAPTSANAAGYTALNTQINGLITSASSFWGPAVTARTGKSFNDGFVTPFLARWGATPTNLAPLANLNPVQQSQFVMGWYDGLMGFTGTDHVDHWMREVNWTPALTQIQGAGSNTVIGLLDFSVKDQAAANITSASGYTNSTGGHGAAVASLIVAAHDGSGVMGIAPNSSVVAYNPFDATGTASWTDVTTGIVALGNSGASIINASLGVSGKTLAPDWNTVLSDPKVKNAVKNAVFVIAAGNDGATQTANVEWNKNNASFIVVGSVDSNLNISTFSNRPGTACLTQNGKCTGDYLMNHFITASGEWILVSDDNGGVTRVSGTSFAAPLVSGAIALLNDRWPWLATHPVDTTNIILKSAKDLGAPGPDPVYGVGLLDVTASQSPLSYDALQWWLPKAGVTKVNSLNDLQQTTAATLRDPKQQATWEAASVYVYGYEQLTESYRDFAIPLSSKLIGQSVISATGQSAQLQSYLTNSFKSWASTPVAAAQPAAKKLADDEAEARFLNFQSGGDIALATPRGLRLTLSTTPVVEETGWRSGSSPVAAKFALSTADGATGVKMGFGEGAAALGGVTGLSLHSDYDPIHGGANPLLGFASGGAFGGADIGLTPTLRLTAGVTSRDAQRNLDDTSGVDRLAAIAVGDYRAQAGRVGMTWRATNHIQLSGGYTRLNENNGLLGVQSTDPRDLGRGTQTDGVDGGADIAFGAGFTLSGTASMGHVRSQAPGSQNLTAAAGGVTTSAFEVVLGKDHLFGPDHLRLSLSQPLHTESGQLSYSGLQVIDRQTGELGQVTQTFNATQDVRPFAAEMLYGRRIMGGAGEFGLFTRAETRGLDLQGHTATAVMTGARLRISY